MDLSCVGLDLIFVFLLWNLFIIFVAYHSITKRKAYRKRSLEINRELCRLADHIIAVLDHEKDIQKKNEGEKYTVRPDMVHYDINNIRRILADEYNEMIK